MTHAGQYHRAEEIMQKIRGILGNFSGYRALHADGRLFKGVFRAYPVARRYSRAAHCQGVEAPVTVRFSKGGGDPITHSSSTLGMATRFYLGGGGVTNLVMLNQKLFIANTVEQFIGLLEAAMPADTGTPQDPSRPAVNQEGLRRFLAANPNSMAAFEMRVANGAPVSFAHTEFNSVHAFIYINAAGVQTPARCHWVPVAGIRSQPSEDLAKEGIDALFGELEDRLEHAPVEFDLELELAEPGDPLNDATALWPSSRRRVAIGRLQLTHETSEEEIGDRVVSHDPTLLTDGIEATDDPILQVRRGVYELSAAQRSGGWRTWPLDRLRKGT